MKHSDLTEALETYFQKMLNDLNQLTTEELVRVETAINAELQKRYDDADHS